MKHFLLKILSVVSFLSFLLITIEVSAAPVCSGTALACSTFGAEVTCEAQQVCTFSDPCISYGAQAACDAAPESCNWEYVGVSDCSVFGTDAVMCAANCCLWTPANPGSPVCTGGVQNCEDHYFDETSCNDHADCSWDDGNGECNGSYNCINFDEGTCLVSGGCTWDPAFGAAGPSCDEDLASASCNDCVSGTPACGGGVTNCNIYDQQQCDDRQPYCDWGDSCTGDIDCSVLDETDCDLYAAAGCSWDDGVLFCDGGTVSCDIPDYDDEASCDLRNAYCTFTSGCTGTPNCNVFNESFCDLFAACTWTNGEVGSCHGTASACSTFNNQTACEAQSSCVWGHLKKLKITGGALEIDEGPLKIN